MAFKDMTVPQMIRITGRWLSADRGFLEKIPELSGSLRMLQKAHDGLKAPVAAPEIDSIKQIQGEENLTDGHFDRKLRGIVMCFAAFAELVLDNAKAERFLQLSKELLPSQLSTVNLTYEEEAGTAESLETKLTDALKLELSALPTPGGRTLVDEFKDLITFGKRLGVLEDQKKKLQHELAGTPSTDAQRRDARLLWIRTINAFLGIVDIAEISKEEREHLLEPIKSAEEVVSRRKRGEEVKDEEDVKDADPSVAISDLSGE